MKQSEAESDGSKASLALQQLSQLCQELDTTHPPCTIRQWKKLAGGEEGRLESLVMQARAILKQELEVSLLLESSGVDRQGLGVFLEDAVPEDKLVGLYPGQCTS